MKLVSTAALSLLLPLMVASTAQAENPDHVRRLLTTNACYGCDLSGAVLNSSHLIGADLRGADLSGAQLTGSNLEGADLTGANLEGADLTGVMLTNASLNHANLDGVNFTRAMIYYVDVAGASLENIDLTQAQVVGTPISVGGQYPDLPAEDGEQ